MRIWRRAIGYFRDDLSLVLLLVLIIGLVTVIGLMQAWPMAILLDSVLGKAVKQNLFHRIFRALLPSTPLGQIIGLAVLGILLKLMQDLLTMLRTIVTNRINYRGLMRVRCDLYRKLQALHIGYHRSQPQGDAIYRLSQDTLSCQAILGTLINTLIAALTLVVMLGILFSRSISLTLAAMSVAPALAIINTVFGQTLKRRSVLCKEADCRFTTTIQQTMSTIGLTQSFGREPQEFARFRSSAVGIIQALWSYNWQEMLYWLLVGTLFGIGGAVVFGYGGYLVYRDQFLSPRPNGMSVGDLMIFTSYLGMLWQPLCTLTGFNYNMQAAVAGAERVFAVLDRDVVIASSPTAHPLPRQPRRLTLDQVCFHYIQDKPVLRQISTEIAPGEMVAFVGASGVGKSTLLNLLPRFYDPTAGALRLDGHDFRDIRLKDLRRHIALVLQESVILPTTIAENIAYGRPSATMEQIRQAAHLAAADSFIDSLPDRYDTLISEGGQNLSGGQRQRIAIARALLSEAPIIVLDEPTSALDPEHEQLIAQALKSLKRQRTIILITHRLYTAADCDRIYVLDEGQIVEEGTHCQLLAQAGLYYRMNECQSAPKLSPAPPPVAPDDVPRAA